jgi:hypothetical protein
MEYELCPFCGSDLIELHNTINRWYYGRCEDCQAQGPIRSSLVGAEKAWNTRPTPTAAPPDAVRQESDDNSGLTIEQIRHNQVENYDGDSILTTGDDE